MKDNIDDFILIADIFCGKWQEFIDNLRKQEDISPCIVADLGYQLANGILVLQSNE